MSHLAQLQLFVAMVEETASLPITLETDRLMAVETLLEGNDLLDPVTQEFLQYVDIKRGRSELSDFTIQFHSTQSATCFDQAGHTFAFGSLPVCLSLIRTCRQLT